MGKLARNKRSGFSGHLWMEQTRIVKNVAVVHMPISKSFVPGISNVGKTYQTLAELTSKHDNGRPTGVPAKSSVSAPTLLLESSASLTTAECPPPAPRAHACPCRPRRHDRGRSAVARDKGCACKRDRPQRREKSLKQQRAGPSRCCLKKTCRWERSVPSLPGASQADAAVQLLYYRDKLTATEQLVEKKDEIIRLQNESLVLAERRLATLTAARMELRRTQTPAASHTPAPVQAAYQTRTSQDTTMQKKQQQPLVQTLRHNLSVMEGLYTESFYEAAKQENIIESLRVCHSELRDIGTMQESRRTNDNQQWTVEQCQAMADEVERLKSEIYNFVNSSNNDSGVWEGEETPTPDIREDLQDITSQLLKLRDIILTDTPSSADDENVKLKERNVQLQNKISDLQSHIGRLESALSRQDHEYGCVPCHEGSPASPGSRRRVKSKPNSGTVGRPHIRTHCHHMKKQTASPHSSVHGDRSPTKTAMRCTDDHHLQDEDAPVPSACAISKRGCSEGGCALTLLQVELRSAQQRSAALCGEARRALARVRHWAQRMRTRLKEREAEIERQKQEIEELRKYIMKLKECSETALPESRALSERYLRKQRLLEAEEAQCRDLRREIERLKPSEPCEPEPARDEFDVDDICEEQEQEQPPPPPCRPKTTRRHDEKPTKRRPPPKPRDEDADCPDEDAPRNIAPNSSCYEINPGEIAEVDASSGMKVLVKCKDCERRQAEETRHREIQTQPVEPRVTTYQGDKCNEELQKKKGDKFCNEELCLLPDKKKEAKKPPPDDKSPPVVPIVHRTCSCSSKETVICQSNDSLRSLRFKEPAEIFCKDGIITPERQVSIISRPGDPVQVPVTLKSPIRASASPDLDPPARQTSKTTKKKERKKPKVPKLEIKSSKKLIKESKRRKDKVLQKEVVQKEVVKQCRCTGPCRCRCSTQAWKMEAGSSRGSRCSRCSCSSSMTSEDEPRNTASSVDSYHSLLMGHLKKKFPFLAHRWGRCEASVQQPLRSDAGTSRSRRFEEMVGVERKSRPRRVPSNTSGSISAMSHPRCLPLVEQQP